MPIPNYSPNFYVQKASYPKRREQKVKTMFRIYELLPAHFNEIQKAVKLTPTTVSKRLKEMLELKVVIVERKKKTVSLENSKTGDWVCRIYEKNPDFERVLLKYSGLSHEKSFGLEILMRMTLEFSIKKRGRQARGEVRHRKMSMQEDWENTKRDFKNGKIPY